MENLSPQKGAVNWNSSGTDKSRELRGRIDSSIEALAKAVDDVRASDVFKAYLDVQAKFHRYSWHNSLLILSQRPGASRVAGFQTWKKIGRHVRKGERGIAIFAPCPWKREVETEAGETETRSGMFFKVVHVFDVAQTDGEALPEVDCPIVDSDASALLSALVRVAESRGIVVSFRKLSGEFGHATDGGKTIAIDNSHPTGQQAKTLAHEIAHCAIHFGKTDQATRLTRDIAELEAESIAYVVCKHFGIDADVRSSRYVALWNGDSKGIRASFDRISETARALIEDCENSAGSAGKAVAA